MIKSIKFYSIKQLALTLENDSQIDPENYSLKMKHFEKIIPTINDEDTKNLGIKLLCNLRNIKDDKFKWITVLSVVRHYKEA